LAALQIFGTVVKLMGFIKKVLPRWGKYDFGTFFIKMFGRSATGYQKEK